MRSCNKCGEMKPRTPEYYYRDSQKPDGLSYSCKPCYEKKAKQYREKYKHKKAEYDRKRREEIRPHLKELYGITADDYEDMMEKQKCVCAICGNTETAMNQYGIKRLAVDHCHETGKVRGLLCAKCNMLLGCSRDNISILINACRYIAENSVSDHCSFECGFEINGMEAMWLEKYK